VRGGIFIMTVTAAQMSFMVVNTIYTFKVFSGFTGSADHCYTY